MPCDPSRFHGLNVIDTCSVWNLLSSKTLCRAALSAGCVFSCTGFVFYECLVKPRKKVSAEEAELQGRLREERRRGHFKDYHLELEDLLEVEFLEKRKRLGKGELSSMAFAKRTRQAFLTDDQGARKLAVGVLDSAMVQTTPHLFGWLFYTGSLLDPDKHAIILEHEQLEKRMPLTRFFEEIYLSALEYRLRARGTGT